LSISSKKLGEEGEKLAADLLSKKGYEILKRNYRFGKGEIDIVAEDKEKDFLVFVEVKTRRNLEYGEPEYAITKSKIRQLKKLAAAYLSENEIEDKDCRFDVVAILFQGKRKPIINHYEEAFY
jgi:putative endonuclease